MSQAVEPKTNPHGRALAPLLAGLVCAMASICACDALDPVQTLNLCGASHAVISGNCAVCRKPPYAANCPQCSQDSGRDARCLDARGAAGTAAAGDAGARLDAAAHDAASAGAGDSGHLDASADAGGFGLDGSAADGGDLDAGGDAAAACGGPCSGSNGVCDPKSGKCVACLAKADCDDGLVCTQLHTCEACTVDAHCGASAPHCVGHKCEACSGTDGSCDARAATPVCDTVASSVKFGQCVACTGKSYAACGAAPDEIPYVCDSQQRVCTQRKEHSISDCAPCLTDAQCQVGQLCAPETFGSPAEPVGNFCFWQLNASSGPAGNCDNAKPLIKTVVGVVSIDGAIATACMPRVSTCLALNDVSKGCESASTPGSPDHSLCGFSHSGEDFSTHDNQDGVCIDTDPTAAISFKCTATCVTDGDCKSVFTCDTVPAVDQCTL